MYTTKRKGYRLSIAQARCWSVGSVREKTQLQLVTRLEGPVEVERLKRVLLLLMEQETILRTTYRQMAGMQEPIQVVAPPEQVVDLLDFRCEEGSIEEDEECRYLLAKDMRQGRDLEEEPTVRAWMRRVKQDQWILLLSLPNLSGDEATLIHLIQAISHEYGYEAGSDKEEQEEPLPYAQVAAWQYDLLQEDDGQEGQAFWDRFELAAVTHEPVPLACKHPEGAIQEREMPWATHECQVSLAREVSGAVVSVAQELGVSVEEVVLACWQIMLWRLREQDEVLLGVACDGRSLDELAQALGSYARIVPFQVQLFPNQLFERVVLQTHIMLDEARKWQNYFTWEGRTPNEKPGFFPLGFAWETRPAPWQEGGLRWQVLDLQAQQEPSILTLRGYQQGEQISLSLSCVPSFLQPDAPARLASCLSTLLSAAVCAPQTCLGALPLLSQEHQAHLRQMGQGKGIPPIEYSGIAAAFEQQVARTPQLPALLAGEQRLSYAQLNARANQLAHCLRGLGVQPGHLVGLWATRSAGAVVALLAILKAGAGYVPLDPEQPAARLTASLSILDSGLVLSDATVAARLPGWDGRVLWWEEDEQVAQASIANPARSTTLAEVAYVIFTSGSSGVPKGMRITQGNLLAYLQGWWQELRPEAGWHYGLVSTLAADLGNTQVYGALLSGGCLRIFAYEQLTDGQAMQEAVVQQPLDVLKLVPSHLHALLGSCTHPEALLPRVALVLGGERFPRSLLQQLRALGGVERLYNHYGPTETTIGALVHRIGEETETEQEWHSVPVGRPLGHMRAIVVDPWGELVPWGIVGELWLGGAGVGEGYVGQAALTGERFVPGDGGARWYRTGDAVRWTRERQIEYIGRRDRQLKIRGQRIEPGEIEAVLCEQEGVREAVVELRTDEQGRSRLVAYVVGKQQPWPTGEELRWGVGERLPAAMVPDAYVALRVLPLTRNGKIDRRALPEPAEEERQSGQEEQEWGNPIEELLSEIWREVLGIKQRVLGRDEHFAHLGGHSLLATQVMARVRVAFGVEIPILALFEAPTIALLGQRVQEALREQQDLPIAPPLAPVSREQPLPLSFAQQRLWFLNQLDPGSSLYNKSIAAQLHGPVLVQVLEQSLTEIVRRHECLRTVFLLQKEEPVQRILPAQRFCLPVVDLHELSAMQKEEQMRRLAEQEAMGLFDLGHGPLLRAWLLRVDTEEHVFLLTMHHIVSDAWSNRIFLRELNMLYQAFTARNASPLPDLAIQYADYAFWQRNWLRGAILEEHLYYWKKRLVDLPALEVPTDHPRPAVLSGRGAHVSHVLPAELATALSGLARQEGVTLFMLLLAAFQVLLACYSRQEDIAVGIPIANRTQTEIEVMIGFFVNTLVLRTDLSGLPSFREIVRRVREVSLGAYAHQDLPFEYLVEHLQPERDLSRHPLFQVMFDFQYRLSMPTLLAGIQVESLPFEQRNSKFDLSLLARESEQGIICTLEYSVDLFEFETIKRLLLHLQSLLIEIVANPDQIIHDLSLLTASEQLRLQSEWNDTTRPLPEDVCMHQLIERQAALTPHVPAVECGDIVLSYEQLNGEANLVARYLCQQGVRPGDAVGLATTRSPEMIVGVLAILKAGAAYVPLDPGYPGDRLAFMIEDSGIKVLLIQAEVLNDFPSSSVQVITLPIEEKVGNPEEYRENLNLTVPLTALAYIIYTSGSTGWPKGVLISQRNLLFSTMARLTYYKESVEAFALLSSISFDSSVGGIFWTLCQGGKLLLPSEIVLRDAPVLVEWLIQTACSHLLCVPTLYALLLQQEGASRLKGLRVSIVAGEACPIALVVSHQQIVPEVQLFNEYGPTEATVWSCVYHCQMRENSQSVSIGRPVANVRIYVLDVHGRMVPQSIPGELYIGGAGVAWGYLNRAELTAERFVPDPWSGQAGERLYRTGDLVRYRENGDLEFLGREDQQVKVRGYRIELGEIETVICQYPSVCECVVLLRDEIGGERLLVAYIEAQEKEEISISALRSYLKERLPGYMVPSFIKQLERLPLTINGKVDRRELLAHPLQDTQRIELVKPRDDLEFQLLQIWEEILNIQPISILDNFFDLGGHSILAVRLASRIQKHFRGDFPLSMLFRYPTVAQQAAVLRKQVNPDDAPILVPMQAGGSKVPFFCIHPAGGTVFCYADLVRHLDEEQPFYGLQAPTFAGEKASYAQLEDLATRYIVAIKGAQPQGPYQLGGWSLGGVIAFEMAQQLQRQGDTVALLVLFDSNLPVSYLHPEKVIEQMRVDDVTLAKDLMKAFSVAVPDEDFYQTEPEEQLKYALEQAKQVNGLPEDADIEQVRYLGSVAKTHEYLVDSYQPQVYLHPITFFRAGESIAREDTDASLPVPVSRTPTRGWEQLVPAGIDLHIVPGEHSAIMDEPYVQEVAMVLQRCLEPGEWLDK